MTAPEQDEIENLREEINKLKVELKVKEDRLHNLLFQKDKKNEYSSQLTTEEISRYSRQMLIPEVGVTGQVALKKSKVLVVGTGGLGCPAALYLAAAGVGEITLVDNDEVEITNLHRQVLHSEADLGVAKVQSGYYKLTRLNSNIKVIPVHMHATGATLSKLVNENKYDVVVDGTDNVPTRYLLNDICVFNKIPLVMGSALQLDGQLTVYNYNDGPCYRCVFPVPPPPETVTSCGDGGVLGVVPGVIGVLQALETIKIIVGMSDVLSSRLLLFEASSTTFRNVKLRGKSSNCKVCGDSPSITTPIDYEEFCSAKSDDKVHNINILATDENISVVEFFNNFKSNQALIDVRPKLEYQMCHIPNSLNVPYTDIQKEKNCDGLKTSILNKSNRGDSKVYVICRRGNDSQRAISKLRETFGDSLFKFVNIKGGLHAYSKFVDSSFPVY